MSHLSSLTVPIKYVQNRAGTPAVTLFTPCLYFHALKSQAQATCQVLGWLIQINSRLPLIFAELQYIDNNAAGCLPDSLDMMSFSQCMLGLPHPFHLNFWCILNILISASKLLGILVCLLSAVFFVLEYVLNCSSWICSQKHMKDPKCVRLQFLLCCKSVNVTDTTPSTHNPWPSCPSHVAATSVQRPWPYIVS